MSCSNWSPVTLELSAYANASTKSEISDHHPKSQPGSRTAGGDPICSREAEG